MVLLTGCGVPLTPLEISAGKSYSANVGQSITFNAAVFTATLGSSYQWNFGDGTTGVGITVTHAYSKAGGYTVTLTVSDEFGRIATATAPVQIGTPPVANAGGPYTGYVGGTVGLDGSGSTAPAGESLTSYMWNFGDGSSGTGVRPSHVYLTAGTYAVTLTVTATDGGQSTAATTVTIGALPTANAGGPYAGYVGGVVSLSASGSVAASGQSLTAYSWNFGDGSTASGINVTHTYAVAGSYVVTLTVTASSGGSATATVAAVISALPVANPGGPYAGYVGGTVSLDGTRSTVASGQSITAYAWNFGDGTVGTGVSPTHTYGSSGTYTVSLTVTASGGGQASSTTTVTIAALPTANAGGPYTGYAGSIVSFDGSHSTAPGGQSITTYAWSFGDGASGTGANLTHAYTSSGTYTVTLIVTASGGGQATATTTATIGALPTANAGAPYTGYAGGAVSFDGSRSTAPSGQSLTVYAWSFGDGATGTGANPTHAYTTSGTYTVTLTVTASGGGQATATTTATIGALPIANAGGPYTGFAGNTISLDGSRSTAPPGQSITTYTWNFGDGATGSGVSPTHIYINAGTYTVTLTVTASGGGQATATTTATVSALPTANAGGSYTGYAGGAVSFDGSRSTAPSGQNIASYSWNFGDGATGTGASPTHTYATSGTYTVSLTVTASGGGQATVTAAVTIGALPIANAGGPYTGFAGNAVSFDASRSTASPGQSITTYAWNFGDGATGTGASAAHTYTTVGTYTVTLTVTASSGGQATATTTATISALPTANAGGPYTGYAGSAVSFDGSRSAAPSGQSLTVYAWSFGDGATGTGANPTHTYASSGTYTVTLTVTASSGGQATATTTATISALPTANAGGPYTGYAGNAVSFDGSHAAAPGGQNITAYAWNFGDGSTGVGVNPTHTYSTAGTYTVTLTVTATDGGQATATASVSIGGVPIANAGGPYSGSAGTAVSLNGSGSTAPAGQSITSYAWNFGDGNTGTGAGPTHTYAAVGTYTVTLTVTATDGAQSTATAAVSIGSLPTANAGGPYSGYPGTTINFDGSASTAPSGQGLTAYAWNFGDGATGNGVNPTHSYATAGTYTATLTVTASDGGQSTATAAVAIGAVPVANAGGPYSALVNGAIIFNGAQSTAPPGQSITAYAWDFGDGATGTGVGPTHTYATAGTYTVTLTVTSTDGAHASATASVSISALPVANAGGPYAGYTNTALGFDGSGSTAPSGQSLTTYTWNFGDGSTGTGVSPTHVYSAANTYTVSLTVTASGGGQATATASVNIAIAHPIVSGFSPATGPVGTIVTVTGTNLTDPSGAGTGIALAQQGGGIISAPVSTAAATSVTFVVPPGAATGPISLSAGAQTAASSSSFTVTTSSSFTLSVGPAAISLIPGQSTAVSAHIASSDGFAGAATLSVSGLPSGVTGTFKPTSISPGQTAVLTLSAPSSQSTGSANLSFTANANVEGQTLTQTATASLNVTGTTTTFMGRTVVDDSVQEPLAGVTVKFTGKDDKGNTTGCNAHTVSDEAGNFFLTNLPTACIGPQLISYDGLTVTSPAGKYAGVNLSYTMTTGQVTTSPVLVHLPRIDDAETVQVQQNSATDQVFYFHTIPGLKVTVYAGTTFALDDGSQPNPFPLIAIQIPIDRLPDKMPTTGMLNPFIVAFQPANAVASMPVSVDFPNTLNTPIGTHVTFVTLDPTHGYMVPYGTGTVSKDGTQFVADADPAHPGHGFGLVHFDWHGPAPGPPPSVNPSAANGGSGSGTASPINGTASGPSTQAGCTCPGAPHIAGPVDLSSGIVYYTATDLAITGGRGSIAINRYYRTLANYIGPFGVGTSFDYSYTLNTIAYVQGQNQISLVTPDGNQFPMSFAADRLEALQQAGGGQLVGFPQAAASGTYVNTTVPALRGAILTATGPNGPYTLRWSNGVQYQFTVFTALGALQAYLTSITDLNGNTTTLMLNPSRPSQILSITDPVGRSFSLTYDSSNRVTQIVDSAGRKVTYTYNGQGLIASFTDANGGVTNYTYDSANNLATITDPRGIVIEQDTYNTGFDNRVTQQVEADGGVYQFAYLLQNPNVATSPVLQTDVTDPRGNKTSYRFDTQGFMASATDANGQTRDLQRDPTHNNLVLSYRAAGVCSGCGNPAAGDVNYTFDQFGNVLTQTDSLGNTTTYTYDTRFNKIASTTDALGHTTRMAYDTNGNVTSATDANGNTMQMAYDTFGELTSVTDPVGSKRTFEYDSFGNVVSMTDALGHTSRVVYDLVSRPIQTIDTLGRRATTAYDPLNRVTSGQDALGKTVALTYDEIGNILSIKDVRGNVTRFSYDRSGRLQKRTDPSGNSENYTYDTNSNLVQYTDRRGQTSTYRYDPLNRLIQESYTDAVVTRRYDARGRLVEVSDSVDGTFGFGYDSNGQIVQQTEPTGVVKYTRDALGRVAERQVVGQDAVQYAYDAVGNMLTATMPTAGVTYQYDSRDLPKSLGRTNGITTNYTFDALGQVLSVVHSNSSKALGTINYSYDPAGQRIAANSDFGQPISTQSAQALVDANNQTTSFGASSYDYDVNGNRQAEHSASGSLSYVWDGRNRLSSITDGSGSKTSMQYDFGRNLLGIHRESGASSTQQTFVVDSLTNVVMVSDTTGTSYSVLTGVALDSHFASSAGSGTVQFGLTDAIGSVIALADSSGQLASQFSYEPYGKMAGSLSPQFPFGFSGRVPVTTDILYFRNRYYDDQSSRFISSDPAYQTTAGYSDSAYVSGDPIRSVDPVGLFPWSSLIQEYGKFAASGAGEFLVNVGVDQELQRAQKYEVDMVSSQFGSASGTVVDLINNSIGAGIGAYDISQDIAGIAIAAPIPVLGEIVAFGLGIKLGYDLYQEAEALKNAAKDVHHLVQGFSGAPTNANCAP